MKRNTRIGWKEYSPSDTDREAKVITDPFSLNSNLAAGEQSLSENSGLNFRKPIFRS